MPTWTPNTNNQIATMIKEKQSLEVDTGKNLVKAFSKPAILDPIRMVVLMGMIEMTAKDEKVHAAAEAAVKEEQGKNNAWAKNQVMVDAVAGKPAGKLMDTILTSFTPTDCSNGIRLYGAFTEKVSQTSKDAITALRIDFKKRERWQDAEQLKKLEDELAKRKGAPGIKALIEKYETGGMSEYYSVQNDLIKMDGGQAQWRLEFDSRVLKLDTWFGLVGASDISGTTSDTIFFLNQAHGTAKLTDPLYHILPLGTIVSGAHHSVVEVALPLSQNGINDYAIGQYTSLMVKDSAHPSKGEIAGIFQASENDKRNHLMCIGYSGDFKVIQDVIKAKKEDAKKDRNDPTRGVSKAAGMAKLVASIKVEGAYVFDKAEKAAFFAMANAKNLHAKLMDKENAWPTQANVRAFLQKNGFPKVV